ncbi:MAG TPA: hypothetical protein VJB57_12700 [Dehalococcoidia bacterium]|nr:hypothetical protein [Dehalococcoidia bacterium]
MLTLGGVALVAGMILIGFLFFSPDVQACANGADALNPTQTPGVSLPQERSFETIAEAERWICHSIVYPRTSDLTLYEITAWRGGDLQEVVEGEVYAEITLLFGHNALRSEVGLRVIPSRGKRDLETFNRVYGVIKPSEDRFEAHWQKNDLFLQLTAERSPGLSQADFDAIKDSIR